MAFALEWDKSGEKTYEIGVDRGVLYLQESGAYPKGVVWNGLITVTESPSGAEPTKLYADNIPYLTLRSAEEFGATVECYTYPPEFAECDGSKEMTPGVRIGQQPRKNFGLCYRTKEGNDTENDAYGYKIHIIYGCSASPSEKSYGTINDSPDAIQFSYEISSTPVNVTGGDPTSIMTIDSVNAPADKLAELESILYGEGSTSARLPYPDEIITLFESA